MKCTGLGNAVKKIAKVRESSCAGRGLVHYLGLIGHAGWSSPVARQAHNLKVAGSNPAPATKFLKYSLLFLGWIMPSPITPHRFLERYLLIA
jgi:hypothetical protein